MKRKGQFSTAKQAVVFFMLVLVFVFIVGQTKAQWVNLDNLFKERLPESYVCTDYDSSMIGKFAWPLDTSNPEHLVIVSCYGERDIDYGSKFHEAVDIRTIDQNSDGTNKKVLAAAAGKVIGVKGRDNKVVIEHEKGYKTYYFHNSEIKVNRNNVSL